MMRALVLLLAASCARAVRFAQVLGLDESGSAGVRASYYQKGYGLALADFEDKGGLVWRGSKVDLNAIDTIKEYKSGEKLALYLSTTSWTEEDPLVVLGGYGSSNVKFQINATDSFGALFINGGGASSSMYKPRTQGGLSDRGLAFGLLNSVANMASSTMEFLKLQIERGMLDKPARIALLWEDVAHGWSYREMVVSYALQFPDFFEILYMADFELDSPTNSIFEGIANDLAVSDRALRRSAGRGFTTLLVDAHSEDFIKLQDALTGQNFNFSFVTYGARGADVSDLQRLNSLERANNTIAVQWWNKMIKTAGSLEFLSKWRLYEAYAWSDALAAEAVQDKRALFELADSQLMVEWYGALAYAAATVMLDAMNTTADQTMSGVKAHLLASSFPSILPGGKVSFDAFGQSQADFTVVQTKVDASGQITADTLFPVVDASADFEAKQGWQSQHVLCDASFVAYQVGPCDSRSERKVLFYWVDSFGYMCENPKEPCACSLDGHDEDHAHEEEEEEEAVFALPQDEVVTCSYVATGSDKGTAILAIAGIGVVFCFASLCVVLWGYNTTVMKAGQREFLVLMSFAGIWCNVAAIGFLDENTTTRCIARIFYLIMSCTLLLGSLTVKVYRIYRIWNNTSMKRIIVSTRDMLMLLALVMFGIFGIFSLWMITGRPESVIAEATAQMPSISIVYEETTCQYAGNQFVPLAAIGYIFIILLICNVLSFQGRNSDAKYLESKSIMLASYCISLVLGIVVILGTSVNLSTISLTLLIAMTLTFFSLLLIGLVVGPKVYYVLKQNAVTIKNKIGAKTSRNTGHARTEDPYPNTSNHTSNHSTLDVPRTTTITEAA